MATFTPPFEDLTAPVAAVPHPMDGLFRHYKNRAQGRNVYILSDGTVTENDPDTRTSFWHASEGAPYIVRVFWGGHVAENVNAAEQALLEASGYTVS